MLSNAVSFTCGMMFCINVSDCRAFQSLNMNEDNRKVADRTVTAVSVQQQHDCLVTTTRLTPFSIDNILGKSRDLAPVNQPSVPNTGSSGGLTGNSRPTSDKAGHVDTTKVSVTTPRHLQVSANVASSAGETMTSSNLEELQAFLNGRLRHQHHHQIPYSLAPHHHHYHAHHPSQLSQQTTGAMPPTFYAQFHRHLSILPSSIDGTSHLR